MRTCGVEEECVLAVLPVLSFTLTAKPLNGVVFEMLELSSGRRRLLVFCVRLECVRFVLMGLSVA